MADEPTADRKPRVLTAAIKLLGLFVALFGMLLVLGLHRLLLPWLVIWAGLFVRQLPWAVMLASAGAEADGRPTAKTYIKAAGWALLFSIPLFVLPVLVASSYSDYEPRSEVSEALQLA